MLMIYDGVDVDEVYKPQDSDVCITFVNPMRTQELLESVRCTLQLMGIQTRSGSVNTHYSFTLLE